jgi:hypothetical protein
MLFTLMLAYNTTSHTFENSLSEAEHVLQKRLYESHTHAHTRDDVHSTDIRRDKRTSSA